MKPARYIATKASYGFQGRYWNRGDSTVVSPEELAEQKKKGFGAKDPKEDKSALKHFRLADGEEHGDVTPQMAAAATTESQSRLMGIPDPDHADEKIPVPNTADVMDATPPGAVLPNAGQVTEEKPKPAARRKSAAKK